MTYGTSIDPTIANQTSCDLSRLSYETFLFNKTIDVVEPTSHPTAPPSVTQEEHTIHPTGLIMVSSASLVKGSMLLVLAASGVLCALLLVI